MIYNDILEPVHKGKWSEKRALRLNRMLVMCIGIFLLLYGLWYPLKGDLWVYLQVTGTIYLASMSTLLIAGCYWSRANDWGALAAILTGCLIPISFLIMQELRATHDWITQVGPYKSAIAAYVFTALAMLAGSALKWQVVEQKRTTP